MTLEPPPSSTLPLIGILCSHACPAALIVRAQALARTWAGAGLGVVGGFHSPTEAEMLQVLLRGRGALVVVRARGPGGRVPHEWAAAQAAGRLRVVSPFTATVRRIDRRHALARNRVVAHLAARLLVLYAAPGSATQELALERLGAGHALYTLAHPANSVLLAAGAHAWDEPADGDANE